MNPVFAWQYGFDDYHFEYNEDTHTISCTVFDQFNLPIGIEYPIGWVGGAFPHQLLNNLKMQHRVDERTAIELVVLFYACEYIVMSHTGT